MPSLNLEDKVRTEEGKDVTVKLNAEEVMRHLEQDAKESVRQEDVAPLKESPEPNSEPPRRPVRARKEKGSTDFIYYQTVMDVPPPSRSGVCYIL